MAQVKVDQQSIADKLGISRSTVTRVLRHDPVHRTSPETRELILETAAEMGYRPRRRRTGNIAFVVCGEMASMQTELHMATCEEAAKSDYRVFLVRQPRGPSHKQLSLHVNPLSADGAIVVGDIGDDVAGKIAGVMPFVALNADMSSRGIDSITVDYVGLGRQLTQRLVDAGHGHIAVIAQFPDDVRWAGALEGYRQALESAGLEADLSMVWSKSGKLYPSLLSEITNHKPRPTGVFAITTSDHAIILSTLIAMGVNVPRDLSYVGWAYSYMAAMLPLPAITCLDDIYRSMAATAVRRLLARTQASGPAENLIAPVRLRSGETCMEPNFEILNFEF